jgi:hypothetical protein
MDFLSVVFAFAAVWALWAIASRLDDLVYELHRLNED